MGGRSTPAPRTRTWSSSSTSSPAHGPPVPAYSPPVLARLPPSAVFVSGNAGEEATLPVPRVSRSTPCWTSTPSPRHWSSSASGSGSGGSGPGDLGGAAPRPGRHPAPGPTAAGESGRTVTTTPRSSSPAPRPRSRAASREQILNQQVVEVDGQADVGVIGVGSRSPYSVDSVVNPILAAWMGLAATFGAHTGQPVVRDGGALILYHPLPPDFSPLHHPSYVDFFADVLLRDRRCGADRGRVRAEVRHRPVVRPPLPDRPGVPRRAPDPSLVRAGPTARRHAPTSSGSARTGQAPSGSASGPPPRSPTRWRSSPSTVGRSPTISYLHTPPQLVAAVT